MVGEQELEVDVVIVHTRSGPWRPYCLYCHPYASDDGAIVAEMGYVVVVQLDYVESPVVCGAGIIVTSRSTHGGGDCDLQVVDDPLPEQRK